MSAQKTASFYPSLALLAILLLGLALRLAPWGQNRFLEDEALYATWGLQIATGADPMLDEEPVDKPPLHPYTLALSFLAFGQSERAARLPSLFASMVSIALVYTLGTALPLTPTDRDRSAPSPPGGEGRPRSGRGEGAALLAALLLALSPFDILFASTAFTDPLMTAFVLAALLAAGKGRLGAAGLLTGLAGATKQQGLFFLPLVVAVAALRTTDRRNWRAWLRFALGFGLVAAGVICWDSARVQRPGFWEQGLISYGGLGPTAPAALGERAIEWLRLVGYFWTSPWFNGLLLAALLTWLVGSRLTPALPAPRRIDFVLLVFVGGFLLLHWLVGFQVWDRYLLGLVPLAALLAARALVAVGRAIRAAPWQQVYAAGLAAALALTLTGPVVRATQSELPLGGDHGAYDGIDQLAAYLRATAPANSVLYHHWLGYHYRFYLYGAPLRLHWYPNPEDLVHDATVYRREPRYIAFPTFRNSSAARATLAGAGITLTPLLETTRRDGTVSFQLYRLEGP